MAVRKTGKQYIKIRGANENNLKNLDVDIQVDGGINNETMETVMKAGANLLVAGSYAFKGDLASNVRHIMKDMDKIREELD